MKLIIKSFEELTTKELYEIIKLRIEVFIVDQECIYKDLDYLDYNCYHHFIEDDSKIVAYLRILGKGLNFDEISFSRVVTNKLYRGKGFCKKLLFESINFVENNLKESIIKLRAQVYAKGLYESLGFEEFGEEYLDRDIPHINMIYKSKK